MLDLHYAALRKSIEKNLTRSLAENEKASVSSFLRLSTQNHEDLQKLKSSGVVAWAYLSYILAPDISSYARRYVDDVLLGEMSVDKFIYTHGLDVISTTKEE